jgi:ABC-type multidrug transport system ATPase subunit/GR25 family glycosyltransferase involved in LPS biosynthesis
MNESILKALIRLFAIFANAKENGQSSNERDIVMDYLDRQYSYEFVQMYLDYFDEQVKHYHPEEVDANELDAKKLHVINEARIIEICNQINAELEQEQKMVVFIYLLDFIYSDKRLTDAELKFIGTLGRHLKINDDEMHDAKAFSFGEIYNVLHKDRLMFFDSNPSSGDSDIKHMHVEKIEGKIVVLRLPSTNTFVFRYNGNMMLFLNGHNIKPDRSYIWSVGSVIKNAKIGSIFYSWMAGRFIQATIENKFVFTASDIEYYYFNSKNGLRPFSFTEESGRLIGIIGGSGCGKSTLLNVLNGNLKPRNGKIEINGFDIHKHKDIVKGIIGYVPQDDLLIKELTVQQNLYFNAKLCYSHYSEEQINKVVEKAIFDFDLVEARELNVGDAFTTILSGGQRKRLNIALELIREPAILFIDEPTSGLSSADSEKVLTLLKRQTLKGKLVIANIHQPSSDIFKMIDKLLVMDQGGRVIYYGHPTTAITYFKKASQHADAEESECLSCGNINTDQILRIIEARVVDANGRLTRKRKTSPQEWYEKYLKEIHVKVKQIQREHDSTIPETHFKIPGHFRQFKLFLQRDILAKFQNKQYLLLNAIEAPLLAIILSYFTKNFTFIDGLPKYIFSENPNIPAFLFMAIIVALFLGMVVSAEEIFKDRKILKREKFLNLSRSSYLFSKITILFALSAVQTLLFVLIGNYMLEIKGMVFKYWIILFTTSCWANLIGLNISSGLNSVVTIYILVPLILVPQLLFSGVVVEFSDMHKKIASEKNVPLVGDMMTSRWAYEALMVTQFKDNRFEKYFYEADKEIRNATYYKSFAIPELETLADECVELQRTNNDSLKLSQNIAVIKKEIIKISYDLGWDVPGFLNSIQKKEYDTFRNAKIKEFLTKADVRYRQIYNHYIKQKDSTYDFLVNKLGGKDQFNQFRQEYYNKQVAYIVTNDKELTEFEIQNNEMIRNKDAIFMFPLAEFGRAQYYAPVKRVYNYFIDTFWYNLVIVWLFSGLLFIFLYYDVLRKIFAFIETLRLNRINRRRLLRLWNIAEGTITNRKNQTIPNIE